MGRDDYSEKLAAKMLGGWTLLGTNCPNCCIPLVRNKGEKKMLCVGCEQWMLNEDEASGMATSNDAKQEEPNSISSSNSELESTDCKPVQEEPNTCPTAATGVGGVERNRIIQNQTIHSLYRKMNTLRQQIDQSSNMTPDQMMPLVQAIKEIASAIQSLQALAPSTSSTF